MMVAASSRVGTIFSRLASTICALGRVWVRSPLPSLVTMTEAPVSAIRKLAAGIEVGVGGAEDLGDLLLVDMHRRRDDVARHLVAQLDDVFAEVGLDRLD